MRSAIEASGDQSIPPSSSSIRWSSPPLPSTLLLPPPPPPPPPLPSTTKSPSPVVARQMDEAAPLQSDEGPSGMEPGPSSSSPGEAAPKSPPREDVSTDVAGSSRETLNDSFHEGDEPQPSTSRAHSDFVENSIPMKFLKPKLEPLDEESSRDGFTPLDTMAHIKTEAGMGRLSEMRSEDSRSEVSNVETKRYRVSFKVGTKAAARLKRILNSQPMALKRLGIAGVQVDSSGGMVSVATKAKERAAEEATRRPESSQLGSTPTPSLSSQPQMRGAPDRNGDASGMMVANAPQSVYAPHPPQSAPVVGHPGMHPGHMGAPPGHINAQHSQMGDGSSGSSGAPMASMPPSALPPHMQQQRQPQPPPTNSPVLVNLLNSQPQPSVGGRPFSPYPPGFSGVPPGGGSGVPPPPAQPQPGQPMDPNMAAFHQHQMQERQRMMMQQQQQQQQQMQQQGVATPTTPGAGPGPSGYGYPQRPMYPGQQAGMFPPGPPNAQQRVPFSGQPIYSPMPQIKQEPGTAGYGNMQIKQEPVETAPPPAKKRKKPTKKQQKEMEQQQLAAQQAAAQSQNAQPGAFFPDGRMMHSQQMQGGFPGGAPPHSQYPPGAGGPPPPGMPAQYYQQQQNQQQIAWQQQMHHQRMMQAQQQQMGMAPDYPSGTVPAGPSSAPWQHPHPRPPPVPYPPGQNDAAAGGVSGVAGTGDMGSHSDSNSPVTPFGGHPMMAQQQQQQQPGHPSPMYNRESGSGTPTLFPYPSTPHGGPGPSGQSGLNSTPLTPGTTPQTPGGPHGQSTLTNDHHDFDDKLLGAGTLGDLSLGDLDDIVPMGDIMMGGTSGGGNGEREGGNAGGDGIVKEEMDDGNGEGGGEPIPTSGPMKRNGRHDLDMSINSVVEMVAKGGGELSSPTPPATATPTGGNGTSAFPVTTPTPTSSTAPPTPTLQTPPAPVVRRKNTASSVQQLTAHQRMQQQQQQQQLQQQQLQQHQQQQQLQQQQQHQLQQQQQQQLPQQMMMGGGVGQYGGPGPHFGGSQGGMPPMHSHSHPMGHPHGHHQQVPSSGHPMDHHGRSLPPSYHHSSRGGGRVGAIIENGRANGHHEMSNGVSSREESGTSGTADETIQAILDKVRVQGIAQEERAKAQRSNTGAKRGGGTGSKRGKRKEIAKERSPKEDGDSFLIGMEELRGSSMTAGQAAKARMGVGQGGSISHSNTYYAHTIQPMRSQPPPVQHKPT